MTELYTKSSENPFPKEFGNLPPISGLLDGEKPLSPAKLRDICGLYRKVGIDIQETEKPVGVTGVTSTGKISTEIPHIQPFGPDVTAAHELLHIEQLLRAIKNGVTVRDLEDQLPHSVPLAEIGAREAEIRYINRLPLFIRWKPAYRKRKKEAQRAIKQWSMNLPEGTVLTKEKKLNPYIKIVEAN